MEEILKLWDYQIRALPLLLGFCIFALVSILRKITRVAYTPSYFVVFPMSLLDHDIATLYGEGDMFPWQTSSKEERKKLKNKILFKSIISLILTFAAIPSIIGLICAFFIRENEIAALAATIVIWQFYNAIYSIIDNTRNVEKPIASITFFSLFYFCYLFCLAGFFVKSYNFAHPYIKSHNLIGLLTQSADAIFITLASFIFLGLLGNLFAYLITEKEIFRSTWAEKYEKEWDSDKTDKTIH